MKKKIIFLLSTLMVVVTAFATFTKKGVAQEIVYDFSVFDVATDVPTSDLWSYAEGDWGSVRNSAALETPTAINARLANVQFTCSGSGNIVWQLYAANEGYGNQLVINSSGVTMLLPEVSKGDKIVYYASANKDIVFGDYSIAKNAEYAEYTFEAESDAPAISMPKNLIIRTITVIKTAPKDIVHDFSVFDAATDVPTSDLWSYAEGDWASVRNAAALETPTAINDRLANVLFTCSGSGNIVWQLYAANEGYGNQLVINSSGVTMILPEASAGDQIVFYASANKDITFGEYSIAKNAEYADYSLVAESDAPAISMPKNLMIRTITIKKGGADNGKTWDFTAINANDTIGFVDNGGNMTGKYSDDENTWASFYNNAAFEGELMMNATDAFGPTKGLQFTANGSKWVYVRFYPQAYGGFHLCSNNKDLQLAIPAAAGKAVIMKVGGNGGTISVLEGASEESITSTKTYEYYMLNATADVVKLKLFKNCYIQKIYVGDAPTQEDPALKAAQSEIEVNAGETATIEYTTKSDIAPTFTSSDESIVKVDANGVVTAVAAGTATVTIAHAENPYFKAATAEVTVKVKTAGITAIDELVAEAIKGAENDAATLSLAEGGEYTLDATADAGMTNLTIEGNGAKIIVGEAGTIAAKQGLTLKDVKIDMTAGKAALVTLPKMTEAADSALYNLHGENGKNSFFNDQGIVFEKVSIANIATPLIQNADRWTLKKLNIKNCIFQLNASSGKFIDLQTGGGDGMIKDINIEGSTIYNLQANDGIFFLAYNTSKPMPEKFYGSEDNTCTWTMTNNTIVQAFKQMSDRYTENKVATVKWTKNVWYSHTNLSKTRNCTFEMTAEDNSLYGGSAGNFATVEDTKITVPTEAYDFNEDGLVENFSLFKRTIAYEGRMGDTRWLVEGKSADARVWDFSNNGVNYADEWALIKADEVNWKQTKAGQDVRYQNALNLDTLEAVVTIPATEEGAEAVTRKVSFLEGLTIIAEANKFIIGDGSSANYKCLQIQKGAKFIVKDVYAGDTIIVTGSSTAKNAVADNVTFTNTYPASIELCPGGSYEADTLIVVSTGEVMYESAKDSRLQKLEIRPSKSDYVYPQLAIRLANDIAKDEVTVGEDGTETVKEFNTKGVRKNVADKDAIVATTKNPMVPVTFTSSNEEVVKVDADGNFEALAPGVATITTEQPAGAGFFGMKIDRFIVVNPELGFHTAAVNMEQEKAELVYTPDALGYVPGANNNGINDYYIVTEYAKWMFYNNGNDGDGYVQAKTGNNSWMKIDYSDGANDSICNNVCPEGANGTNACYRPSVSGDYELTMDYYITGIEAVKFYYCTSASTVGGLRLNIYENNTEGEPVQTLAGVSDQKGKAANGFSFTVQIEGLDKTKNYIVRALREGPGDCLVYAAKFYTEFEGSGITEFVSAPNFNNGAIYNLSGQRVSVMKKGDIYIKDGKKFIFK